MAIDKREIPTMLRQGGVLPLFFHHDARLAREVIAAAYMGGLRVFEFTNRGENAFQTFTDLLAYRSESFPEMALGIGTVYDSPTAEMYIKAGADFIVQPILNPEVGKTCSRLRVPWIPGVATPTEIYFARQAGAEVVKLFPGETVGPSFVKAMMGPMADLQIMVTGGVKPTFESFNEWFSAGAACVGLGSHLFPKDILERKDYGWIEKKVAECLEFVKTIRAKS